MEVALRPSAFADSYRPHLSFIWVQDSYVIIALPAMQTELCVFDLAALASSSIGLAGGIDSGRAPLAASTN